MFWIRLHTRHLMNFLTFLPLLATLLIFSTSSSRSSTEKLDLRGLASSSSSSSSFCAPSHLRAHEGNKAFNYEHSVMVKWYLHDVSSRITDRVVYSGLTMCHLETFFLNQYLSSWRLLLSILQHKHMRAYISYKGWCKSM